MENQEYPQEINTKMTGDNPDPDKSSTPKGPEGQSQSPNTVVDDVEKICTDKTWKKHDVVLVSKKGSGTVVIKKVGRWTSKDSHGDNDFDDICKDKDEDDMHFDQVIMMSEDNLETMREEEKVKEYLKGLEDLTLEDMDKDIGSEKELSQELLLLPMSNESSQVDQNQDKGKDFRDADTDH